MSDKTTGEPWLLKCIVAIAMAAFWLPASLQGETRTYQMPDESARLLPGPDVETAEANCVVCHSVDYVKIQPPGKGRGFWTAEVTKMIKVFGAPIGQEDAAKIIGYLAATY
jgi:hypothetical protein